MTHDIPRFGTPDGGLTWASTGTHGGTYVERERMDPDFVPPSGSMNPDATVAPTCGVCGDTGVCHFCRGGSTADVSCSSCGGTHRCRYCAARPGYLDGDDGLTWAEQVAQRDAEIARLRALIRTVDLCGTGFVWRDRTTGKEHLLNPIDVDVIIGAEHQTEVERLRAELDQVEQQRDTTQAQLLAAEEDRNDLRRRLRKTSDAYNDARNELYEANANLDTVRDRCADLQVTSEQLVAERDEWKATAERLRARLLLAETHCVIYGSTGSRMETDREKASTQSWMDWFHAHRHEAPDVTDEQVAELARRRDEIQTRTLAAIAEDEGNIAPQLHRDGCTAGERHDGRCTVAEDGGQT